MTKTNAIHTIIHSAASAAATAGAGLAQVPGSDNAVIMPIQVSMIIAIAKNHGKELNTATAISTLATASASIAGKAVSQTLFVWIPGLGNVINASTAFAITEAIGWAVNEIFEE
ncbi:hypothetical protein L9W80_00010 [Vibrio aestuarianus]|uniref:hypothetical protein n=1 Tax=Vibrio aestuarianus TaxID=28171 RepID=UPI00237C67C8|nr:hypothetical protein [Vibrio aestuarianus]MDE1348525.1 hypothetical protein [Vibrio aestuarianus]